MTAIPVFTDWCFFPENFYTCTGCIHHIVQSWWPSGHQTLLPIRNDWSDFTVEYFSPKSNLYGYFVIFSCNCIKCYFSNVSKQSSMRYIQSSLNCFILLENFDWLLTYSDLWCTKGITVEKTIFLSFYLHVHKKWHFQNDSYPSQ